MLVVIDGMRLQDSRGSAATSHGDWQTTHAPAFDARENGSGTFWARAACTRDGESA
jgi:hypothetical protein